jgi:hypothetical protein
LPEVADYKRCDAKFAHRSTATPALKNLKLNIKILLVGKWPHGWVSDHRHPRGDRRRRELTLEISEPPRRAMSLEMPEEVMPDRHTLSGPDGHGLGQRFAGLLDGKVGGVAVASAGKMAEARWGSARKLSQFSLWFMGCGCLSCPQW